MGQIQNAINSAVSATVGANVAKELKETKEKAGFTEAVSEKPKLEEELAKGVKEEQKLTSEIDTLKKGQIPVGDGLSQANLMGNDLAPEISRRELALTTLRGKQKARQLQIDDYAKTIEKYNKKRGLN